MIHNTHRIGNFTSSNIHRLLSINSTKAIERKKALTYIEEKNMERILGRSLTTESDARPLQWGKLCERFVFESLSTAYTLCSDTTLVHPTIPYWVGSPDAYTENKVPDIKCPLTLKSFFLLTQGKDIYSIIDGFNINGANFSPHPKGEEYFNQIVSNAIIMGKKYGELIVFVPHKSQLDEIRAEADFQGINWVKYATDDELPYVPDSVQNQVSIEFEIPQKQIDLLTEAVTEAGKMLI
jgi:hypothetical protein